MKIIYDAMGGDYAPLEIVKGAVLAKKELNIEPILSGNHEAIEKILNDLNEKVEEYEILDANTIIENDEEPVVALRRKKDSSLVVGLNYLAENNGDGLISAGSTGALLAGGLFIIKRIDGVERTPIATLIPTKSKPFLLVDTGANVDTTPELLNQFAIMGSIYSEKSLGNEKPKVGLLNIGKEEGKGNNLYKKAYTLLAENKYINFIGNVEAREIPYGVVDVVIADGFDGNIFLKTYEGTASMIMDLFKENLATIEDKQTAGALKDLLYKTFAHFQYSNLGGAPLLGLNKPVFKAHGISDAQAILGASKQLKNFVENEVIETMIKDIKELNE
ncbi:MAG: phosphate acyltransferase PlsX [Tissierellia bacterium]|nr:phosphate acyltransferase PlsX [Tissierellia bacterium]